MKKLNKVFVLLTVVFVVMLVPMVALAKTSRPYKDVTKKTVGTDAYNAIVFVKKYGGWKGIAKNGQLKPNKYVTRKEVLRVLSNLYGINRVPTDMNDVLHPKAKMTSRQVVQKLTALSDVLKCHVTYPSTWKGCNNKITRAGLATHIRAFALCDSKSRLMPKK